jgi:sugar lactone lactonase YvrE
MRAAVAVALAALVAVAATSAAPRVRISKPPAGLHAGETWLAHVRNAPARIPEARDVEVVDAGSALVTSGSDVVRVDVASGATTVVAHAEDVLLGLVRAQGGALYVSEGGARVVRIAPDGSRRAVLAGRDGLHGMTFDAGRLIACESFAGNVLSVDVDTGAVQVLARGLANPGYATPAPAGLYVSEFRGGRIDLLAHDGSIRPIATLPDVGSLSPSSGGTLLATALSGAAVRVDPGSGSVTSILH